MFRKQTYTPKCKKRFLLVLEIVLYLVGIGLLIQIFFVRDTITNTFDSEAAARLIISPQQMEHNTEPYQLWQSNKCNDGDNRCPIQLFHYYLFNITNPAQVRDNKQYPKLHELGPFVFNRYEIRKNVTFSADATIVNYKYEYEYVLNEQLSNMSLWNRTTWYNLQKINVSNDSNIYNMTQYPPIYMLNPFMLAAFAKCRISNNGSGGGAVCNVIGSQDKELFYVSNYTAQSILQTGMFSQVHRLCNEIGGIPANPLCNTTQKYIVDDDNYVSEYTGIDNTNKMRELISFYRKNQTIAGAMDVIDEFYEFWEEQEKFEGLREPKQWPYDTIRPDSILNVYMMDKYRHVDLIKNGSVYLDELELYKFIIDPNEYLSSDHNPENRKYYQYGDDGLLNLTTTNGADVLQYTSKPYFLDAPDYAEELNNNMGLRQPNRSLDDTFFAIEPKLGMVFRTQIAYQISFGIYPCKDCGRTNHFENISDVIVPQLYVVLKGGAPDPLIENYKEVLALLDTTSQYSVYVGPAIALCCFVIAFYLTGRRYCKYRRNHNVTFYMDFDEDWSEMEDDGMDNQIEDNVEDIQHIEQHHNDNDDDDDEDDWNDSIYDGYARRDNSFEQSLDKTIHDNDIDIYTKQNNESKWKNKNNSNKEKKHTSKSKLLNKISSKMDAYSS